MFDEFVNNIYILKDVYGFIKGLYFIILFKYYDYDRYVEEVILIDGKFMGIFWM